MAQTMNVFGHYSLNQEYGDVKNEPKDKPSNNRNSTGLFRKSSTHGTTPSVSHIKKNSDSFGNEMPMTMPKHAVFDKSFKSLMLTPEPEQFIPIRSSTAALKNNYIIETLPSQQAPNFAEMGEMANNSNSSS